MKLIISHFTIVFLSSWPLSGSEAEVALVMIDTLHEEALLYTTQVKSGFRLVNSEVITKSTIHLHFSI